MTLEIKYTKADHDRNHKILGKINDCVWCAWELDKMEAETLGISGERA